MSTIQNETVSLARRSLAEVAAALPHAVEVFEDAGIDFCCRGSRTVSDSALAAGYSPAELVAMIEAAPSPSGGITWSERPLTELAAFLAREHAELAGRLVPQLRDLLEEAASRRSASSEVRRIAALFSTLAAAIVVHMAHEERDLYSAIAELEHPTAQSRKPHLGGRVLRELVEHEQFNDRLRTMRELGWRCTTANGPVAIVPALRAFSRRMHFHMHLENNVLYPRAIATENDIEGRCGGRNDESTRDRRP